MTEKSGPSNKAIIIGMVVALVLGLGMIAAVTILLLSPGNGDKNTDQVEGEMAEEGVIIIPTATFLPTATETPLPTTTPTPDYTSTPTPTNTPLPTNTYIPATAVPPTATFTPAPLAGTGHNLTAISFTTESTTAAAGGKIWFNFSITSTNSTPFFFGRLGVVALRPDSSNETFQTSWSNAYLQPNQPLNWRDRIVIANPGTYNLYLSICYSEAGVCLGGGEWEFLSGPIQVTIS